MRWRKAHGLGEGGGLAAMPVSEEELLALLGETPEHLAQRAGGEPPDWWRRLEEVLAAQSPSLRPTPGADSKSYWLSGFSRITAPFVRQAMADLEQRLRTHPVHEVIALESVLKELTGSLAGDLVTTATRTLVLELNVMRVQGRLAGDTAPERFWSFVEATVERRGELFDEYPVLARRLVRHAETCVEAAWEFFERWWADREHIRQGLGVDPTRVEAIRFGLGDPHRGGRSVSIVELASGEKVVYKPRPLSVHARFNALLAWLNAAVPDLELRQLSIVDRADYGWVEFAEHIECGDEEELEQYYRRLGALMALLYTVDGADFHFENLIAAGAQPVIVDLETLFHQRLTPLIGHTGQHITGDPALHALESSVVRLGILPILVTGKESTLDLGGLGGDPGGTSPFQAPALLDAGTDVMRIVRRDTEFTGAQNRPKAGADPLDHIPDLLDGFRDAYRAIARRRNEFARLLDGFADAEVRIVVRPTQVYGSLLTEGNHPDLLRDALDYDRHLSLLWADVPQRPDLARVVPYEIADLWAGDIPVFSGRPGSRDLWTSTGHRLPDCFPETALERVHRKIDNLGRTDLAHQEWMIRAALVTRPGTAGGGDYLSAAKRIGDRLLEMSISDGDGRLSWLGLTSAGETDWRVSTIGWSFYSGASGIALFLDTLGRITGEARYCEHASRALWSVPEVLADCEQRSPDWLASNVGGLGGLPGLAYTMIVLKNLGHVDRIVRLCAEMADADMSFDILKGGAGNLAAMLAVHAETDSDAALKVAVRCGERLLHHAVPGEATLSWPPSGPAHQPLTGFSHGAAGIGWALVRLGTVTGDRRFVDAGLAAFRYERSVFRPDWGNWPDFRKLPAGHDDHMYAWCHGAMGIGLARADVMSIVDDPGVRDDLEFAVWATLARGFGLNHSQCHGDTGNLELLLSTGRDASAVGHRLLRELDNGGPRCGTPGGVETPSLMTGLAGIGYGLLRLAEPQRVPAILLCHIPSPERRTA